MAHGCQVLRHARGHATLHLSLAAQPKMDAQLCVTADADRRGGLTQAGVVLKSGWSRDHHPVVILHHYATIWPDSAPMPELGLTGERIAVGNSIWGE